MFRAFHRAQEAGDFLRARHDGKFLRLPAGWDVICDYPRPFQGDGIDEPECGHGHRNRAGRQTPLLDQINLPSPYLVPAQPFGWLAEMAGEPRNLVDVRLSVSAARGYGSAYPRSCGGEVGSLATPLRDEQRHMARAHRLAVELFGQEKRRKAVADQPNKIGGLSSRSQNSREAG
jgi:hypothetical protein